MSVKKTQQTCDVAIIGSGPAGISAAITLKKANVNNILVIERETEAGGIPRHCGHIAFGLKKYKHILTGIKYAKKNITEALNLGIEIRVNTTVIALAEGGKITLCSSDGIYELHAKRVLIATGIREKPCSARFASGGRALGIYNTGALQNMIYLKSKIPFKRPVIVGTEIVSFSALLTCKKGNIKPVAIIESKAKPSVRRLIYYMALLFGVKILLNTTINKMITDGRVRAVEIIDENGNKKTLNCDGVLFTGEFVPESGLIQTSHLAFDDNLSPVVDETGRCSDDSYYAAGNVLQLDSEEGRNHWLYAKGNAPNSVNTAGFCWKQGADVAKNIIKNFSQH